MNIDLTRLNSGILKTIEINSDVKKECFDLSQTELLDLKNVHVNGNIYLNSMNEYEIDINISGVMVLPCSITLDHVEHKFSSSASGNLEELLEETGKICENNQNSLDILPIVWENILMEIPMKVVSEKSKDVTLKGEGWQLITETKEEINPELEKLKDLL